MKLIKSKKANINYLAKIIRINGFESHPNADALKCAFVDGYKVIVGLNEPEGKYVYFPTSCEINPNLLTFANLYRDKTLNANSEVKPGFFENNGRVKAVKLRGIVSEGFLMPLETLCNFISSELSLDVKSFDIEANIEFDSFSHNNKEFWICKKYIIKSNNASSSSNHRKAVINSKIVDGQFRKHYETAIYRKEPTAISPYDLISISSKWDGTSQISAYILCKQKLNWKQKIAKWLTGEEFNKYDYVFSSRNVIQNENLDNKKSYYGTGDYSSRLAAHKVLEPHLIPGMSIYYEIVGYTNEGKAWIKRAGQDMDYGCIPSTTEYKEGINFKIYIYRITLTNIRGDVHEFSPREVQKWCDREGLRACEQFYYGFAGDLFRDLDIFDIDWCYKFIDKLADNKDFYMEMNSPDCNNKVPHEGIVIKKDDGTPNAVKLKTFLHLSGEQRDLDTGITNTEDES